MEILQKLTNLSFPNTSYPNEEYSAMCGQVCSALLKAIPQSSSDVKRVTSLIVSLCSKQEVLFAGPDLENCIVFCLDVLKHHVHDKATVQDSLNGLGNLLFENGHRCSKLHGRVIDTLLPLADPAKHDLETVRFSVHCLGNITLKSGAKLQGMHDRVFACLLNLMETYGPRVGEDVLVVKLLSGVARALQLVITEGKTCHLQAVNRLVAMAKALMFFAFNDDDARAHQQAHTVSVQMRRGKCASDSDSDRSDREGIQSDSMRRAAASLRAYAVNMVQAMARTNNKTMYPHWPQLLPLSDVLSGKGRTIPSLLLYDLSPRVRLSAGACIQAIFEGARQYVSTAEDTNRKAGSFISLSSKLAGVLREIHNALIASCRDDKSPQVAVQSSKALVAIVSITQYERLQSGMLAKVVSVCERMCESKDIMVRSAAMQVLATVLSTKTPFKEVEEFFMMAGGKISPLMSKLVKICDKSEPVPSVRADALCCMSRLARTYPVVYMAHWGLIDTIVRGVEADASADPAICTQSVKNIEECARSLNILSGGALADPEAGDEEVTASVTAQPTPGNYDGWWKDMYEVHVPTALQSKTASVRASAAMAVSHTNDNILTSTSAPTRNMIVSLVLSSSSDDNAAVRAAACRALGVFVLLPSMREDEMFMEDAVGVLERTISDDNVNVRARACWLLANLCDSLSVRPAETPVEGRTLSSLVRFAMTAAQDNDKVRSNAVRALGNLCRIPAVLSVPQISMDSVVGTLCTNVTTGTVKVRWNSCYAIQMLFKNESLARVCPPWMGAAYRALLSALVECSNYKVRINAVNALATPSTIEAYGDSFGAAVESVVQGVALAEKTEVFAQFKYKETLQIQTAKALFHLASLKPHVAEVFSKALDGCEEAAQDCIEFVAKALNKNSPAVDNIIENPADIDADPTKVQSPKKAPIVKLPEEWHEGGQALASMLDSSASSSSARDSLVHSLRARSV